MKKIALVILPLLVMILVARAADDKAQKGITFFDASWKEVAAKAHKEKKLVFMDIYTTWCGPCKMLRKTTFTDKAAGEYFNANFVNTSVDAEKGEGVEIANKYHVEAYPTLLILDENGNELGRQLGFMPAEGLIRFGKSVKK